MSWKTTVSAATVTVALSIAPHASERITPPAVPTDIEVTGDFKPFLRGHAVGTQNFICAPAATATGVDWFFLGPQATVFDDNGEQILTHFLSKNPDQADALQATWQHSGDSSTVWAKKRVGSTDATYVAPGAIEWLLLDVTGAEVGPLGGEKLSKALLIQRVNTVGGVKPPAGECTPGTINSRKYVNYEADYYFYR
jgi:hypothetical protein